MAKAVIRKPKKKVCQFCKEKVSYVDYKDTNLLRLLERPDLAGGARVADDRDLLLTALGPGHGVPPGDKVVAAVAVLDLDDVPGGTEAGDLLGEDELHLVCVPSAS